MILSRSLSEGLVEILVRSSPRSPCMKILRAMSYRWFYESSRGRLLGGSCIKIL